MDTNSIRIAIESAIAAAAARTTDSNKWSSLVTIVTVVVGFLTLLVPILAGYFKSKSAEAKATLSVTNSEEAKRMNQGMSETIEEVRKDVNSGATAMREKLAQATEKILDLSTHIAGLKQEQQGQKIKDAEAAAVAIAMAARGPAFVPAPAIMPESTPGPTGGAGAATRETVAAAKETVAKAETAASATEGQI